MDGAAFKAWREGKRLSQAELAEHLDAIAPGARWSRDAVANREGNRAAMPADVEVMLVRVAERLQQARADARKAFGQPLVPYGSERLDTRCMPLALTAAVVLPLKSLFWKYGWCDHGTGNPFYNLYQVKQPDRHGKHVFCTYVQMDAKAWRAREVANNSTTTVDKLNAWFDRHRAELERAPYLPLQEGR